MPRLPAVLGRRISFPPSSSVLIHSSSGTFLSLQSEISVCRDYTLFGSSQNYSSDFLATTPAWPAFMHLGYTDSVSGDGSTAGILFKSGKNTGSSWECHGKARRKSAWLQPVIVDPKTHFMMGIYECTSWSSRSSWRLLQLE
jgi:hypothetical protein